MAQNLDNPDLEHKAEFEAVFFANGLSLLESRFQYFLR